MSPPGPGNAVRTTMARPPLLDLAVPGIDNDLGRRAILHDHDLVDDPAIGLFADGADVLSGSVFLCQRRCGRQVDRSFQQAGQLQLVLLVKLGYRGGGAFTDDLTGPGIDGAFPYIVLLIGLDLVGQLARLTVKTHLDDPRIAVSFRGNPD